MQSPRDLIGYNKQWVETWRVVFQGWQYPPFVTFDKFLGADWGTRVLTHCQPQCLPIFGLWVIKILPQPSPKNEFPFFDLAPSYKAKKFKSNRFQNVVVSFPMNLNLKPKTFARPDLLNNKCLCQHHFKRRNHQTHPILNDKKYNLLPKFSQGFQIILHFELTISLRLHNKSGNENPKFDCQVVSNVLSFWNIFAFDFMPIFSWAFFKLHPRAAQLLLKMARLQCAEPDSKKYCELPARLNA